MFEQAEPVFRDKTISSQNKIIDSTIVPWERFTVSTEEAIESIKSFYEALNDLPQSIGVVTVPSNIELEEEKKANKGIIFDFNNTSCKEYLPEFYRILKDKSILYLMCNNTGRFRIGKIQWCL